MINYNDKLIESYFGNNKCMQFSPNYTPKESFISGNNNPRKMVHKSEASFK